MPKITEQVQKKQTVKRSQPKQEEIQKQEGVKPEPKVVVFRLFECLTHLEIALAQLKGVGIYPGPEADAQRYQASHQHALTTVECLYRDYKTQWGLLQK